jgi:hypothetical protein
MVEVAGNWQVCILADLSYIRRLACFDFVAKNRHYAQHERVWVCAIDNTFPFALSVAQQSRNEFINFNRSEVYK